MDPTRFDTIVQSFSIGQSRRGLLAGLSGVLLAAVPGVFPGGDAGAKRKGKGKGKGKGKKKGGRGGNGNNGPPPPPPPACTDGLHNGDETDVDCGGSCPTKCANGEGCSAHGDCQSGNCVGSLCRECLDGGQCALGEACVGFACCTVDGFEPIHACADDAECCSGNCATHGFGTTCRPAGCLPTGANCGGDPGVCCSFTCSGTCR